MAYFEEFGRCLCRVQTKAQKFRTFVVYDVAINKREK